MKKLLVALLLVVLGSSAAFAAEGKIVAVTDGTAVVDMGSTPGFKAGSKVKLNGKAGKVTAVDGNKLSIQAPNVGDMKAGDTVKVDKAAAALQGC